MNMLVFLVLCLVAAGSAEVNLSVPEYTSILDRTDEAAAQVKSLLAPNNFNGQFIMLLHAVNALMNSNLEPIYFEFYYDIINKAIQEALDDPQRAANSVRTQIDKILSKILAIREVINKKQNTVCKVKISYECDLIIDIAVRTSSDDLIKAQAHLLQTIGSEVDTYLEEYAAEFDSVAKSNEVQSYLVNSKVHLWPLCKKGLETRAEAQSVLPSRRFNSITIEVDY